jgi:hypothetical protein
LALRAAWATYLGLALVPPAAMIGTIFYLLFTGNDSVIQGYVENDFQAGFWFLVFGMIFLGLALPAGFWFRQHAWREYEEGGVAKPRNYLKGWLAVWLPLVAGGVLGFIGLALTREFATVFISMLAFVVFLAMSPNGHVLTRPVGDVDDPGTYEEPK